MRGEIEPLLARDLTRRWGVGTLQAEALAAEVLRFWEGAGLLDVYRLAGQEWLAFRHLTFQEYGAARALAEAYQDDADGLWQCLSPHLLRPQWAGVIPLALAHLAKALATNLVEHLLAANGGDEDRQPPLFLAAAALAEGARVVDALSWQVIDALLNLGRMGHQQRSWHLRSTAKDAFSALGRLVGDGYAAAGLLALARDQAVDGLVRVEAVKVLGRLERADDLLALAWDPAVDGRVRVQAVEALKGLGRADDLLALAWDQTVDGLVRVEVLGRLERADDLLALARDPAVDDRVRMDAAEALRRLGRADKAVVLLLRLAWDRAVKPKARMEAAEALRRLGQAEEEAELLLALARDRAVEDGVRLQAVMALERLGRAEQATELLLALAQDRAEAASVRVEAVKVLGRLWWATPEVLTGLRTLREEPGTPERVRQAAREALERLEK